jgi:hypothetical protein
MDVKALKDLRAKIFNDLHSKKTILDKRTFASLDKAFKSLPILKEFKGNQNPNNAKNLSKLKSHHTKLLKVSDLVNQHNSVVNTKKKIKELEKKEPLLNDIKNYEVKIISFGTVFYIEDPFNLVKSSHAINHDGRRWIPRSRKVINKQNESVDADNDISAHYLNKTVKGKIQIENTFNKLNQFHYYLASVFMKDKDKYYEIIKDFVGFEQWFEDLKALTISQDREVLIVMTVSPTLKKENKKVANVAQIKVKDDSTCHYFNNAYINYSSLGDNYVKSLYSSDYIQKNHLKSSCLASLFIDVYKEAFDKKYKLKLTYESYNEICRPYEPLQKDNNAYCLDEHKKILEKFKLALYVFDLNFNIIWHYEPEKRSTCISPKAMYVIMHNKHVYHINHNIKSLEQKIGLYFERDMIHIPSSSYKIIKKENKEFQVKIIESYDQLKSIITDENIKGDVDLFYLKEESCFSLWKSLYLDMKFEASFKMFKDKLDFGMLRLSNINRKNIQIYTYNEEAVYNHNDFDNNEKTFTNYMIKKQFVHDQLLTINYKSTYSPQVQNMLKAYGKGAIIGSFDDYDEVDTIHLDYNKYYTSILKDIKKMPIVNSFDNFIDYNNQELEDYNLYFVEKLNSKICYPLNKFSLCFGMNLKNVADIKIISFLQVSKLRENTAQGVIEKIYGDETLTNKMKKDLFNHLIGNYNKGTNKNTFSCMSNNEEECNAVVSKYGGRKIPLKMGKSEIYLNYIEKEADLSDGFKLISMLIYDISHKKLFNLKENLERNNITVYGANTDCLYIENNKEKLLEFVNKNKEEFGTFDDKNSYEAIGKIKLEEKILPSRSIVPIRHDVNHYKKLPFIYKNLIHLKDEWNSNEINSVIDKYDKLIIKADIAGAGKTASFVNYSKFMNKKMLFVVPWNSLKFDLKGKGMDAITLDKLKGLRFDGEEINQTLKSFDISDYDCIVFDEIYLYDTFKLKVIKDYMNEHKDKKFYATGDENQNKPIESLSLKNKKAYYNSIIATMFPNSICLHDNKRCKTKEDQIRIKKITRQIRESDFKDVKNILFENFKVLYKPEEIFCNKNVCALNNTVNWVNGLIHKPIDDEKYYVGLDLICKKSLKFGSVRSCVNGTYTIIDIDEDDFTLADGDDVFEVDIKNIKSYFSLPYAKTCHSYQGISESEAITIFDINHFMVDNDWIYTAITRATDLQNIYIYMGDYPHQESLADLKKKIQYRIEGHKKYDADTEKGCFGKYISVEWVMNRLKKNKTCIYCKNHFDTTDIEAFSIDRKDNNIGHIELNCQIICRKCNVSKK